MSNPDTEITCEQVQELHDFLSVGELPEGYHISNPPKLGANKAWIIIWFLQERLHLLRDTFEMCWECKSIIDSEREGEYSEKMFHHYCDGCAANRRFRGQKI